MQCPSGGAGGNVSVAASLNPDSDISNVALDYGRGVTIGPGKASLEFVVTVPLVKW